MAEPERARHSLRRRITLTTLLVFLVSIWALSYYASRMLRVDMELLLADQQSSTTSYVAAELDAALQERIVALETVARSIDRATLAHPAALWQILENRPILQGRFNSGIVAVGLDGTAVADAPVVSGRRGTNYFGDAATRLALSEGKSVVGSPVVDRVLKQPLFNINAPIRDADGKVIGALLGVINLAKPNFLDRVGAHRYGKSGGYIVMDPKHNLIVMATDKTRVLQRLPDRGSNALHDKRSQGFAGPLVATNPMGVETLSAGSHVPAAGWLVLATLPAAEAFAPIRDMQQRIVFAAIFLTLIAGVMSCWLLRRQFAPLRAAVAGLQAMSGANQPLRPLPVVQQDEIGQLVGGFNQLLTTLGQREAQLATERDFFSAVLQQASDGVFLFDPDNFEIREVNPSICRMLGYQRNELLALKLGDLLDADPELAQKNVRRILQDKLPLACERNFRKKDGAALAVEVNAGMVETGGRQLIMVNLRDLTGRILLEHRAAQSQQRMELALLGADLGLWDWHVPSGTATFNERWVQMLGYSLDEIEAHVRAWEQLVHPDDWPSVNAALESHLKGETPSYRSKHRLRHKDGHWVWIISRGRVVERDADGKPVRAAGTHLDISAQKISEEAHMRAQLKGAQLLRRIELLMKQAKDCIMMLDSTTRILEVSDGCIETYGYTREELLAMRALDLRSEQARVETTDFMQRLAQHSPLSYRTWHRRKDGTSFPIEIGASMIEDGDERFVQVIMRDISEQVRERSKLELELAAYAKRLELASRRVLAVQEEAKRRFSGELHDRTSPNLAAIKINLGIIARLAPAQSRERAERVEDTQALIDDTEASLREICAELRPAVLDHAGLAAALEGYAHQFARRTGIAVRVDCADGERRLAPALESLLFRIYQEALTNCAKHARASSIMVGLSGTAQPITLTIADDGAGFDLRTLETDGPANGLGLLNMREMIEFSGGRFAIESCPGQGTRIEVVI